MIDGSFNSPDKSNHQEPKFDGREASSSSVSLAQYLLSVSKLINEAGLVQPSDRNSPLQTREGLSFNVSEKKNDRILVIRSEQSGIKRSLNLSTGEVITTLTQKDRDFFISKLKRYIEFGTDAYKKRKADIEDKMKDSTVYSTSMPLKQRVDFIPLVSKDEEPVPNTNFLQSGQFYLGRSERPNFYRTNTLNAKAGQLADKDQKQKSLIKQELLIIRDEEAQRTNSKNGNTWTLDLTSQVIKLNGETPENYQKALEFFEEQIKDAVEKIGKSKDPSVTTSPKTTSELVGSTLESNEIGSSKKFLLNKKTKREIKEEEENVINREHFESSILSTTAPTPTSSTGTIDSKKLESDVKKPNSLKKAKLESNEISSSKKFPLNKKTKREIKEEEENVINREHFESSILSTTAPTPTSSTGTIDSKKLKPKVKKANSVKTANLKRKLQELIEDEEIKALLSSKRELRTFGMFKRHFVHDEYGVLEFLFNRAERRKLSIKELKETVRAIRDAFKKELESRTAKEESWNPIHFLRATDVYGDNSQIADRIRAALEQIEEVLGE